MRINDYHITGMAGTGMSALAQFLIDRGFTVSGSDRLCDTGYEPEPIRRLLAQGVSVYPQDGRAVGHARHLVVSSAIEDRNPEVLAAGRQSIPISHRARVLADTLPAGGSLIAVTGTSGKSTVTAILGCLLDGAGLDPTVVNGAEVMDWEHPKRISSVRKGRGKLCLIEADESDRSLLFFSPQHAVITNASEDHFDLANTVRLFDEFKQRVAGEVIDGVGHPAIPPDSISDGWGRRFEYRGEPWFFPLPGTHNLLNAVQAIEMALRLGCTPGNLRQTLASFKGVKRRLQRVYSRNGIHVVDDYAHNPAKLRAAWTTLRDFSERIVALWRPHGFGPLQSMLENLENTFGEVCRCGDLLLIAPVYDAGGTADRRIRSDVLVERLLKRGVACQAIADLEAGEEIMLREVSAGTTLLTLGARDPRISILARRLAARLSSGR